jgi:membrane-associated phospholipid phosphatase
MLIFSFFKTGKIKLIMLKRNLAIDLLFKKQIFLFTLLVTFLGFILIVVFKYKFSVVDLAINQNIDSNQVSILLQLALILHYVFDTPGMFIICLSIVLYFYFKKLKLYAFLLAAAMLGEWILTTIIKLWIHTPRPLNAVITVNEFSFPSGHVMGSTVLFGILLYFVWKQWNSSKAKIISTVCLVLIELLIGASRIYLNVHWFSDVLGAYLLAVAWLSLSVLLFEFIQKRRGNSV